MKTPKLNPRDFDTEVYSCIHLFYSKTGSPVLVLMNKNADTPCWCVLHNCSDMHFTSYRQAMEFCAEHGWTAER